MHKIYLASQSPRRRQILEDAGLQCILVSVEVEESFPETLEIHKVAEFLACKKAEAIIHIPEDGIALTADTIVVLDEEILGKPNGKDEAREMLRKLSGRVHEVITGVCMLNPSKRISFSETSLVQFADLDEAEIEQYISSAEPYDKAGSYGIQSGLGMLAVENISGSYFNIMGLPIHRVYDELKNW